MIILYIYTNKQRIDNFLNNRYKKIPKNMIYSIIRKGVININKKKIKPKYKLKYLDIINIPYIYNKNITLKKKKINYLNKDIINNLVLYEDKYLLILNKPSGISVHGGTGLNYGIIEILRILRPNNKFLELVHRLDKDTSGVLLIAKNYSTLVLLHKQFRMKNIKKFYLALVKGKWASCNKIISISLSKKIFLNNNYIVKKNNKGKLSETHFKIKEKFSLVTLLRVIPITGRTHQIRVHTQYMGHPIVFDKLYGDKEFNLKFKKYNIERLFLHAEILYFKHPYNNKMLYIKAPLCKSLELFLGYLRKCYL